MSKDLEDIIVEELKALNRKIERLEDKMFGLQVKFFVGTITTLLAVIAALVRYNINLN